MKNKDKKMTEQQFVSLFKRKGFELYKSKGIKAIYRLVYDLEDLINKSKKQ